VSTVTSFNGRLRYFVDLDHPLRSAQTEENPNERVNLESELISEKDAAEVKRKVAARATIDAALPPSQHSYYLNFASVQAALNWLNEPLVQSAGEVTATARNDGTVGMLTIYPPTAPLQSPQRWAFESFNSPTDAVNWLNEPAVQSDGEVSATLRNNGTVGMFVIVPSLRGSLCAC
jgi:hypothetical protein